jgi:prepilin-type N-terminal cleavage/methylation domain-containing protein
MKRNQSGFTLIEIAIVLVIIGLLLGGVLKGQELINSAKVKNLATDFRNLPVTIYGYQDKFKALPGDDACAYASATCPNPHMTAPTVSPVANGNGNGVIEGNWNDITIASESYNFWQHVRVAGLAPGSIDPTSDYRPTNAAGGAIGIQSGTSSTSATPIVDGGGLAIHGTYIICSAGILGKFVKQLDTTLDDGNTATGSMLAGIASKAGTPMTAVPNASIDDAASYTVCMGV